MPSGRDGGDEFVLCMPAARPAHVREVLERIERAVAEIELRDCPEIGSSVSIGATRLRRDETVAAALHRADALLYTVKRNGRGRFVLDESIGVAAGEPSPASSGVAAGTALPA